MPDPPWWISIVFIAALIGFAVSVQARTRLVRLALGAAALMTFALIIRHPWKPQLQAGTLELTAIDVGQGDSLLVVFPDGKTMLVDGGGILQYGRQRRSNFDMGEDVVGPYLWHRGIRHLDVIAVTHAHEDHIGGIRSLIVNFQPGEIWAGANVHLPKAMAKRAGDAFSFGGATVQILSPPQEYAAARVGNNDSLAMRITFGDRSFLLTGDMEAPMESRLLHQQIHTDVLKVGHHGSKTSTIPPFLEAVAPAFAVISVGAQNSFGHPTAPVLERLAAGHIETLRTDLDGLITFRTDGHRISVDSASWHTPLVWSLPWEM